MKNIFKLLTILAVSLFFLTRADAQPVITAEPRNRTNNIGDNAFFSVAATGAGELAYQWKQDGAIIADATDSTLNVLTHILAIFSVGFD